MESKPLTAETELNCQELVELVTEYLEGAMSSAEMRRFEEHLGACKKCGMYFDQMRLTIRTTGALSEDTIQPEARNELLNLFRDWKQDPARRV